MVIFKDDRLHQTFPLARQVLDRSNLSPDFDYHNIELARIFSSSLDQKRYNLSAAEIASVGLIGKIFLILLESYQDNTSPTIFSDLSKNILSLDIKITDSLLIFLSTFPDSHTYASKDSVNDLLISFSNSTSAINALWKTIILISLANENPAFKANDGVFADSNLWSTPEFRLIVTVLDGFFSDHPHSDLVGSGSLLDLLREPSRAFPGSIRGQLEYIRQNWAHLIGEDLFLALLRSIDKLKEEQSRHPGPSKQPQDPLKNALSTTNDYARFSDDLDWMPKVTLLAKNVFVWLDQLSRYYQKPINKLDKIPDEELLKLSNWGFSGLWLIGVWERSVASQKIKQLCGNLDAVPSAYSLYDYTIAAALGGEPAYENLAARANKFHIRLAADMVPNHMGIYSKWVDEHPERFLSLDQSPYPNYSFNGPDLSTSPHFSLFLEDHYYDKSDAAVIFKRVDNQSQSTKYIYHGNDGTAMPWNDTAQLDFMRKDVREGVIQTIIQVAKKFPIIRFDAAMTLAKKHFHRLWFPEPGSGGAIPTRSDWGLSKDAFDKLMPNEFWREVVDRISQEVPDTLLLAEAFWMMEGYFVRSLGMHRVYNSAFMHMLRDEDNAKYRRLIIDTLELDPEILKRYVNFMNNPDEETAIAQFGSDGKYFGTCVMMSTLPGLPMFGHGQIEGYSEKYGMEYQRAYYQETQNDDLVNRHIREIFPLLHKRYLFAEVSNFFIYNFSNENDITDENVFAYSNKVNSESTLVIFHNKWGSTKGSVKSSVSIKNKSLPIFDNLGLDPDCQFVLYRDQITNLEYIRSSQEIQQNGFDFEFGAFQYHVFLDFRSVKDPSGHYLALKNQLNGRGDFSIEKSIIKIKYSPLFEMLYDLVNFVESAQNKHILISDKFTNKITDLINWISVDDSIHLMDYQHYRDSLTSDLQHLSSIYNHQETVQGFSASHYYSFLFWLFIKDLNLNDSPQALRSVLDLLAKDLSLTNEQVEAENILIPKSINLLLNLGEISNVADLDLNSMIDNWFSNPEIKTFIDVHLHDGIMWFNKESFESLIDLYIIYIYFNRSLGYSDNKKQLSLLKTGLNKLSTILHSALVDSGFQVEKYQSIINELSIDFKVG